MIEDMKKVNWLEDALDFDVYLTSNLPQLREVTDYLFGEISKRLRIRKKARSKETLKMVLANLWVAYECSLPVRYSRTPSNYTSSRRYGMLHFRYNRVINIVDTLVDLGFVHQEKGFFDREKNLKRQTRMYATEKLISLFRAFPVDKVGVVEKVPPRETIQLKDKQKHLTDYSETDHTVAMRVRLNRYNTFIRQVDLSLEIPGDGQINLMFLKNLKLNLLKGLTGINRIEIPEYYLKDTMSNNLTYCNSYISLRYNNNLYSPYSIIPDTLYKDISMIPIDYISTMTRKIRKIEDPKERQRALLEKSMLRDFGICSLDCQLNYELLHRVFNNGSFDLGGRFFGAYHLGLGNNLRAGIRINGNPTVELDYSALHIRMLYHMEGIDYKDDPYTVSDRQEDRVVFKLVQLVAINASDEKQAIFAIRDTLRREQIQYDLTNESIVKCLEQFKAVHKPVAKYLNTGIGLRLQNLDSMITQAVLEKLTRKGVACLPLHDSYIVEAEHKQLLLENMTEEYEKIMKFEPVID